MKLCVNCKHFNRGAIQCTHPDNMRLSRVSGLLVPKQSPDYLRSYGILCGPDAHWFEERKEQAA